MMRCVWVRAYSKWVVKLVYHVYYCWHFYIISFSSLCPSFCFYPAQRLIFFFFFVGWSRALLQIHRSSSRASKYSITFECQIVMGFFFYTSALKIAMSLQKHQQLCKVLHSLCSRFFTLYWKYLLTNSNTKKKWNKIYCYGSMFRPVSVGCCCCCALGCLGIW